VVISPNNIFIISCFTMGLGIKLAGQKKSQNVKPCRQI
jgi:hypothetical protein